MATFELRLEGQTVARIEVDAELLRKALGVASAPAEPTLANAKSAPLSAPQASELIERADKPTREFLSRLVEEGGWLTWGETKLTLNVKTWSDFAEGPLKKLEKGLRRLTGDKQAVLVWRNEFEWIGLEKGEDEVCRLHIDGPALAALKTAFATP